MANVSRLFAGKIHFSFVYHILTRFSGARITRIDARICKLDRSVSVRAAYADGGY